MKRSSVVYLFLVLLTLFAASCQDSLWGKYDNPLDPDNQANEDNNDDNDDDSSKFTLTIIAGEGGTVTSPPSPVKVRGGDRTHIVAVPNAGYEFVQWTVVSGAGVNVISGENAETDVILDGEDGTIQANFSVNRVMISGLSGPSGLAVDALGRFFVAERWGQDVVMFDNASKISTVYAGIKSLYGFSGDGGPATEANFNNPTGITFDTSERLYIADSNNNRLRRVDAAGYVTTVAGGGWIWGEGADGGPATDALLGNLRDVTIANDGAVYLSESSNCSIRKVDVSGTISTVAGTGSSGYTGDGGPAVGAMLRLGTGNIDAGSGIDVDASGNLYIADTGNHVVRRVDAVTKKITTIAGNGVAGGATAEGIATDVSLTYPTDVLVADDGTVFIADSYQFSTTSYDESAGVWNTSNENRGRVCAVVGGQLKNLLIYYSDIVPEHYQFSPSALAFGPDGVLYVADLSEGKVIRVDR